MEACVFKSRGPRGVCDGAIYRTYRQDIADAPAQLAAQVKRGEGTARFGEMFGGRVERNLAFFERGENGLVGQAKQQVALVFIEIKFKAIQFTARDFTLRAFTLRAFTLRGLPRLHGGGTRSRQRHRGPL